MIEVICALGGLLVGGVIVGLLMHYRAQGAIQQKVSQTEARAQGAESTVIELRNQCTAEQKKLLEEATKRLSDTFEALSSKALRENNQSFLDLARSSLERVLTENKGEMGKHQKAVQALMDPLSDALTRYERNIRDIEMAREGAYKGLGSKIEDLAKAQKSLEQQTTSLVNALRSPVVRGKWGEITLQRVVELAGLSQYCDFDTQTSVDSAESRLRPDLLVRLPGGRTIVVDSKVPLNAYMDAMETEDAERRREKFVEHAAAVRSHVRALSQKSYWSQFESAPEFVILFLPGESFFSAALEGDRSLIDDGIRSRVILATPTTLIMALLTVAHSWQQQQLAENAKRIAEAGTVLYDRLCTFVSHFADIRKGITGASEAYNKAVGSWEHRVEPGVRTLKQLGAAKADQELPHLDPSDAALREPPIAGELGEGTEWR
jgi:DNA recombination protein RmuC